MEKFLAIDKDAIAKPQNIYKQLFGAECDSNFMK